VRPTSTCLARSVFFHRARRIRVYITISMKNIEILLYTIEILVSLLVSLCCTQRSLCFFIELLVDACTQRSLCFFRIFLRSPVFFLPTNLVVAGSTKVCVWHPGGVCALRPHLFPGQRDLSEAEGKVHPAAGVEAERVWTRIRGKDVRLSGVYAGGFGVQVPQRDAISAGPVLLKLPGSWT